MQTYKKILSQNTVGLPAVTTIDYDENKKMIGRTFFCLNDLESIFSPKPSNEFSKLFPIVATWQKNADYEGRFKIKQSIVPREKKLVIEPGDVQIMHRRYLPAYVNQTQLRERIQKKGPEFTSLLSHAAQRHDESRSSAESHTRLWPQLRGISNTKDCPADYYLKKHKLPKTKHGFLFLAKTNNNRLLAASVYERSPHNYQTILEIDVDTATLKTFEKLKRANPNGVYFQSDSEFCLANLRSLVRRKNFTVSGAFYDQTQFNPFTLGTKSTPIELKGPSMKVKIHRVLNSLIDPQLVAQDFYDFVNLSSIVPGILIDAKYASNNNFVGSKVPGYLSNTCLLTRKAANQLAKVQKDVDKLGLKILVMDCYRPRRAVRQFVRWSKGDLGPSKKPEYHPKIPQTKLIPEYIAEKSGHSRGSVVDLTLVEKGFNSNNTSQTNFKDCTKPVYKKGQIDMGTHFDCFSPRSHTANTSISKKAQANHQRLKKLMEKHGFVNYSKEWWHYSLKQEPHKGKYFDFEH